jgi:hypothetical protein
MNIRHFRFGFLITFCLLGISIYLISLSGENVFFANLTSVEQVAKEAQSLQKPLDKSKEEKIDDSQLAEENAIFENAIRSILRTWQISWNTNDYMLFIGTLLQPNEMTRAFWHEKDRVFDMKYTMISPLIYRLEYYTSGNTERLAKEQVILHLEDTTYKIKRIDILKK